MKHLSPLRYPGGKSVFYPMLKDRIVGLGLHGCIYAEPYAGGAGAALRLLHSDVVSQIYLNDIDKGVYALWYSILHHPDDLIALIQKAKLSIPEWQEHKLMHRKQDFCDHIDRGFNFLYLNRCNRSGIIKAGVIGGYSQAGTYTIKSRFNKIDIINRINWINSQSDRIQIFNLDAIDFLSEIQEQNQNTNELIAYIDPPYYKKGKELYTNYYQHEDHVRLAHYLLNSKSLKWILSYDDAEEIKALYNTCSLDYRNLQYHLETRRIAKELLIESPQLSFACL